MAKQEAQRRQTIEYEYQMKAALKQQKLREELEAQEQVSNKNRAFMKDLFNEAERERRET